MDNFICKIEIPKYIRKIQMSKARKKKHFELGKKIPDKYVNNSRYEWKQVQIGKRKTSQMYDAEENEFVIANPRSYNTPKWQVISGQQIYSGSMNPNVRAKVMKELKKFLKPYVDKIDYIDNGPVGIFIEVHDVIIEGTSLWDLDNRIYPYFKAFQDTLTGNREEWEKKIEDDNIMFVTETKSKFIPIDNTEDRKLVVYIYKETDKRILNHKEYKK